MTPEQEIAFQRIKDPAYLCCEGTEEQVKLLQLLLEKVANSEWGAQIIANLKKSEDLPEGHKVVIKMQESKLVGLPPSKGVHKDNGTIILFFKGNDITDKQIQQWAQTLAHELCHEEQFHQGLHEFSNFTPEQNFIINRLTELDSGLRGRKGMDEFIQEAFEGKNGGEFYASTYNSQALTCAIEAMHEGKTSDKSFEDVKNTLIKRLGTNIDPEYFSIHTLANSPCGSSYFTNEQLPIDVKSQEMTDGRLSTYKHSEPLCGEMRIYTPKEGTIAIKEHSFKNGRRTCISTTFVDRNTDETILAIERHDDEIKKVQTKKNPSNCKDIKDFQQVVSSMNLPEDVQTTFNFNPQKIENFITYVNENHFDLKKFFAENSEKQEATGSKQADVSKQILSKMSDCRGGIM